MLKDHLEKLQHFVGCVNAGSIRKYAIQNNFSQSAISKCVQILESELEVRLLIRSRGGLQLTRSGQELVKFAEELLSDTREVEESIRNDGKMKLHGSFTMGTYQSIAVYFVPNFFKFIREQQQDLSMNLFTAPSKELVQSLRNGGVDFIVSIDPPDRSDFFHEVLLTDTYSLYKATGQTTSLTGNILFTIPYATGADGKSIISYLEEQKISQRISACSDFESVKALVEAGVGYGLMPDRVARPLVEAGKIQLSLQYPKLVKFGRHNIVFSCRKIRAQDKSIRWLNLQLNAMLKLLK